ncbi:hypothetical protein [Chondromyces apiculatus]|uniref:Uncharacterized protein n=1 Tax=Chondromyces apiculatus DSM 436 TaxID=1192034 RepID=A0A017T0G5_9BACT|nr:hypothetical protein [Chondromyces apiculatus]EYF02026.1 Hypothetical protein CAP_7505 [Chondromyces apiculatus DSM 436]
MGTYDTTVQNKDEGRITTQVEERTSQLPSIAYLALSVGAMAASAGLMLAGKKQVANFIGQWAPSLLVIGLYNKVVKLERELLTQNQTTPRTTYATQGGSFTGQHFR